MADIDLAALQAAMARGAAAPAVAQDWNGSAGNVNLAKPSDHVGVGGKVVLHNNNYDLRGNMAYQLWVAQGCPNVATPLTQDHINAAIPAIRMVIARYRIYKLCYHASIAIVYRRADVFDIADIPAGATDERAIRELYAILTEAGEMEEKIADVARLILLAIEANAIHREQNEDHSWYTDEMANPRSATSKACTIAGRDKDKFRTFMMANGHDNNHHLDNATIAIIANIISGTNPAIIDHPNDGSAINYNGRNVRGYDLRDLFATGEAAKGRYPAGVLGKAALIIGGGMITPMLIHLGGKVKLEGTGAISQSVSMFLQAIQRDDITHETLLEVGRAFGPTISLVYGYSLVAKIIEADAYQALDNHALRYPNELAAGKSLAQNLKRVAPHREAITGAIISVLNGITVGLNAAMNVRPNAAAPDVRLVTNPPRINAASFTAEVGAIGGGGGAMFFDADEA